MMKVTRLDLDKNLVTFFVSNTRTGILAEG
ncbi:hypothetical protein SAMN04487786_3767 [Paenisporosarcina quisquiliarum]|nr:hypothetical protein SAMN04487786_3767 [Paenisporosarcina quisquiliarum]